MITKDNTIWGKTVTIGGNSNRNSIRFPSRKRSKRVWKNFYKLFPMYKPHPQNFKIPVHESEYRKVQV